MHTQSGLGKIMQSTSEPFFSSAFVVLRVGLGLQFFLAGIDKMNGWSAAGYLSGATGPLAGWFQALAGNPIVDQLNIWGLTLIGLGLIVGLMTRPAAFFGAILMVLYYLADFTGNTAHGYIDEHIIYSLILIMFVAGGAGHVFGLNPIAQNYARRYPRLANWLFG